MNPYTSSILLTWIVILLWLMLSAVWTTKIILYFFLLLWLRFLHQFVEILLYYFFYLLLRFLHQTLSLCFLKRFFTFPISTFKLLVKNVRHTCGFYYCILSMIPSTLHVGFTSPHLYFSHLLSILFFVLMSCDRNQNVSCVVYY